MASIVEIPEYLRSKMIQVAEDVQSLTHPDVIAVSQQLDRYILQAQRVMANPELVRGGTGQSTWTVTAGDAMGAAASVNKSSFLNRSWESGLISGLYPSPKQ
ncbi:aspartyl-phosphate phosphatase Spo0E family protein [Alicyclobacillus ferrooxydans]|uniref:Uncharacterized protein n=1 Tax=Alicyclobacillus ferrooxydans TaxID=471514 RepID=A0A0P9ET92_9BACL|nr:aspartyl-phosphate phosphatase Spo0E family protein [Alicyclobacillus ferrooxydans]KPV41983.1 hypothetical protein AN477_19610 [Alicyclobacillus ferrooxydans]